VRSVAQHSGLGSERRNPRKTKAVRGRTNGSAAPAQRDPIPSLGPAARLQYEAALIRAIVTLKFDRNEPLGRWFACRLVELVRAEPKQSSMDNVVPVPLH